MLECGNKKFSQIEGINRLDILSLMLFKRNRNLGYKSFKICQKSAKLCRGFELKSMNSEFNFLRVKSRFSKKVDKLLCCINTQLFFFSSWRK
jgi:hypothetical protein